MNKTSKEINYMLESCCSGVIKKINGKGPERTKVDIKGNYVTIDIRGILSDVEKIMLTYEENYKRVEDFRQGLMPILRKEMLKQISKALCREVEIVSCEENILNNSKSIILKIV